MIAKPTMAQPGDGAGTSSSPAIYGDESDTVALTAGLPADDPTVVPPAVAASRVNESEAATESAHPVFQPLQTPRTPKSGAER